MTVRRDQYLGRMLALAVVYTTVAKLGLMMDAVSGYATLVWPAAGVALAALVLGGYKLWPGIALGAFVANLWTGGPLLGALGISVGNTLEALLGALALRHVVGLRDTFDRLSHAIGLLVLAAMLSTTVSATIGVASLHLAGALRAGVMETWRAWWLGDAIGDIVVGSLLLAWAGGRLNDRSRAARSGGSSRSPRSSPCCSPSRPSSSSIRAGQGQAAASCEAPTWFFPSSSCSHSASGCVARRPRTS